MDITLQDFHLPEFKRIVDLSRVLMLVIPTAVQFNRVDYHAFIDAISRYITAPPFGFFKLSVATQLNLPYQLRVSFVVVDSKTVSILLNP